MKEPYYAYSTTRFRGERLFGCGQVEFWAQRVEVAAEVWYARALCRGRCFGACVGGKGGKNLVDGEWGLGYFGPREIAKRHLMGYSRDLTEGWLWEGMRSISI